jgi:lysophospholipase L1-like esterase
MRTLLLASLACLLLSLAAVAQGHPPLAAQPIERSEGWWQQRHREKLAELHRGPVDLVFLGDSITQDYEQSAPPAFRDFRPVWEHYYGNRHALNLGFSGDATSHLLWRIDHGEIDGISPRVAIILIGANNMGRLHWPANDDIAGVEAVVAAARRKLPRTQILLLSVLPSERSEWVNQTTAEINHALASIYGNGAVPGVTWLDVTSVFMPGGRFDRALYLDPLLTPPAPPLHPTPEGQARMAAAIEPTLARLMGDRPH